MNAIKGLIVDDSKRCMESVRRRLDPQFERYGWTVNWHTESDAGVAHHLVRTVEPFDFAVVDLLFDRDDLPDQNESRGLELITEIRERSERTFIFGISAGDPRRLNLFDDATRLGANHVAHRGQFTTESTEHSPAAVCAAIRTFLLNNGTVCEAKVWADENDPAVQSVLFRVGKQTIAQLYGQILEANGHRSRSIQVSCLGPSASGAEVCAVTAEVDDIGTFRHVLKMSTARTELRKESERAVLAGALLEPRFFVRHDPEYLVGEVNGWYALGAPLLERASTLRKWLAGGPAAGAVEDVFEALFLEGVGRVYTTNIRREDNCALDNYRFAHYKQQQILQAIDELQEALVRPEGGNLTDTAALATDLSSFIRDTTLKNAPRHELPTRTYATYSHGDMHCANILIYQGKRPTPTLIDASDFGIAHWAKDPARLAVDLLMRSFDTGADSLFFNRFATWRELAAQIGDLAQPLRATCPLPATRAAFTALNWLVTNLRAFCLPLATDADFARNHWEWRLALASWLLRNTCYVDVAAPKRAVAIVAAHDQLTAIGQHRVGERQMEEVITPSVRHDDRSEPGS